MDWLNRNAAPARIVASGNRFSTVAYMIIQYCLQSATFAAGIQINHGLQGPLSHARHPMLSAIHHKSMACLRLHPLRQESMGYLAGYGPWHEYPRPAQYLCDSA